MERYDYEHEVRSDLKQWLKDEYFPYKGIESADDMTERVRQDAYDDAFVSDSVTGNASGSYYCNAWKAEEALCHKALLKIGDAYIKAEEELGYAFARGETEEFNAENKNMGWMPWNK